MELGWGGYSGTSDLDLGKKIGNLELGWGGYSGTSDLDLGKKIGNLELELGGYSGTSDLDLGKKVGIWNFGGGYSGKVMEKKKKNLLYRKIDLINLE